MVDATGPPFGMDAAGSAGVLTASSCTPMNAHQHDHQPTGIAHLLRTLRRRSWLIAICAILAPAAAVAFSLAQEKQYSSSASLLFRDPQFDQKLFSSSTFDPNRDPAREAATNVKLVSLDVVATRTSRALNRPGLDADAIQEKVKVKSEGQSDVASITATDPSPAFAARLANTFAEQFIAFRRDADRSKIASAQKLVEEQLRDLEETTNDDKQASALRQRGEQLQILAALQTGNAELVQPARPPKNASSPKPVRNGAAGLVLGLLLGLGLALLLERLDRRLKDPRDISEAFDRPILGAIPESRAIAGQGERLSQRLAPGEAEAFRMLRANLRYFNVDREIHSVLITSSAPADGKSTVAMHLAAAAAASGARVLLMEADLRHPTLARRMDIAPGQGLSNVLAGQVGSLREVAHSVPVAGRREGDSDYRAMDVVVSGPIPPNPTDLIESESMRELIHRAEAEYDLVVVDTPPTSVVSDAIPLVKEVSGVIVVSRLGKTTRESAAHLRSQLENLEANTLGVVVNSVGRQSAYYGYGYAEGYAPAADAAPPRKRGRKDRREDRGAPDDVTTGAAPAAAADPAATRHAVAEEPRSGGPSPNGAAARVNGGDSAQPSDKRRGLLRRKSRRQPPGD